MQWPRHSTRMVESFFPKPCAWRPPQSFAVDGCQGLVATLAWCSWSVCPLYPFVLVLIFYLNPNKSKPPLFCLLAGRAISGGLPICRDRGARSWTCKARCSESVLAHFHNMYYFSELLYQLWSWGGSIRLHLQGPKWIFNHLQWQPILACHESWHVVLPTSP